MFINSETVQAIPIKFAVKIVRLKVYIYDNCQSNALDLHSRSQEHLLFFNLQYLGQYLSYCIQTWHDIFMHGLELDLD